MADTPAPSDSELTLQIVLLLLEEAGADVVKRSADLAERAARPDLAERLRALHRTHKVHVG